MPKIKRMASADRLEAQQRLEAALLSGEVTVGAAIREMRQKWLGLKREDYARVCGVHPNTLGAIERDEDSVTARKIEQVLAPLGYQLTIIPRCPEAKSNGRA